MTNAIEIGALRIDARLYALVRDEIAPGTGVEPDFFWTSLGKIVRELAGKNKQLLQRRAILQKSIDDWCVARKDKPFPIDEHMRFLKRIGYLARERRNFTITTTNVDREIAKVSGPQLVVPLDNARYALNAANARWGSFYDALYGSNVIAETNGAERGEGYNPRRGAKVIAYVENFLDEAVGLDRGRYSDAVGFLLVDISGAKALMARLSDGSVVGLADPTKFAGYIGSPDRPSSVLLKNNELHIEMQIDREHPIGKAHSAGVKDVILEAAITTIQDCEDSVAAVDAADKIKIYRNWANMMNGTLEARFERGGGEQTRRLNSDKKFTSPTGEEVVLPGRSLLLVRNVGMHMYTGAVTTVAGEEIPEGFLDAMMTALGALHDLRQTGPLRNSRTGSVYIVKPKMHSPEEVAATVKLFGRVEDALGLKRNTLKIGIMDEERRLTVNLREAMRAAKARLVFINTGFLDRTGDEIHTWMEFGAMPPKAEIRERAWFRAYEDWNVDSGIAAGLAGRAQIGKGMWTMPDEMRRMVETKGAHPSAGANTAWVPSPTAATLHALHYHQVSVTRRQADLATRKRAALKDILTPAVLDRTLTPEEINQELENNTQSILGYVVRWIDQGIGCSKVPDISNVALMEDRATLRIASQHIANWLHHGIVTGEQVNAALERMAQVVDRQNHDDPNYRKMAPAFTASIAFRAAADLIFKGRQAASGYTEPVLHARRREKKAGNSPQTSASSQ
jgi:malate synthase